MYRKHPNYSSFEQVILPYLENKYRIGSDYSYSYWFHATRKFKTQTFSQGILSLAESIDYIWDQLEQLVKGMITRSEWQNFRTQMTTNSLQNHSTMLYSMKISDSFHHGPYGFLIKETILSPEEMNNWDYLGASEIVYDICMTFQKYYGFCLLSKYINQTQSCIVKFRSQNTSPTLLGVALAYCFCRIHKAQLWDTCSYAYVGRGKSIVPDQILSIETIPHWSPINPICP